MPKNIRLCAIGTKILEFFLVSSTALALCVIWFGLIRHTWVFGRNPAAWIAGGIAVFLAEFILFWIGIIRTCREEVKAERGLALRTMDLLIRKRGSVYDRLFIIKGTGTGHYRDGAALCGGSV